MFPDNLGWGEVGVYGGVRGAITPRLDRAGGRRAPAQQLQRRVLLHGLARGADDRPLRHPHRRDAGRRHHAVGSDDRRSAAVDRLRHGALRQVASRRRPPGEPRTRRSRASTSTTASRAPATRRRRRSRRVRPTPNTSFIWEGRAGSPPRNVKPFDLETRRTIDRESAERGIAFMERSVRERKPFFLYYPMTQIHFPTLAHPDFAGQDRRGRHRRRDGRGGRQRRPRARRHRSARHRAQHDRVLVHRQRRRRQRRPWRGSSGPWSGFYNSVMEGGIRTPCIVRWPGRIPAGRVIERDRARDRSLPDASPPRSAPTSCRRIARSTASTSCRSSKASRRRRTASRVLLYANAQLRAVKWHDWKLHYVVRAGGRRARRSRR